MLHFRMHQLCLTVTGHERYFHLASLKTMPSIWVGWMVGMTLL